MELLGIFLLDTAAVSKTGMLKTMMLQGHFKLNVTEARLLDEVCV